MIQKIILLLLLITDIYAANEALYLSPSEKRWLQEHTADLKVGITQIPNQILFDKEKRPYGFAIDFYHEIEKLLHIQFQYIHYKDWDSLLEAGKKREVDIVFLAQKTEPRLKYFDFTDTVLTQQNKIIVNNGQKSIQTAQDLSGKKIAVVAQSALMDYLKNSYNNLTIIPTKSELESLEIVSKGKADATIEESVRAAYYINKYALENLYAVARFGFEYNLRIASRSDSPVLNVLLNKAVESISVVKKEALYLKWGYIKDEVNYFDRQTLIYLAIVFGIVIPFSIYLFFMNRRLKREINEKKRAQTELSNLNQHLEERIAAEVEKNRLQQLLMFQQNRLAQMGEMIAMIAHQWRQPLNILSLNIQHLQLQYEHKALDDKAIETFEEDTKLQIQQMAQTIDDFQDFFKPNKKSVSTTLNKIIDNALTIIKPIFNRHNIKVDFIAKSSVVLTTYPNEMGQVIINILNNAKDAFLQNSIRSPHITIKLQEKSNAIVIEIQDNAGGVPDEIIEKIFEPYFSTKESKKGTGLGLYMSKMIIKERCGGDLSVQNSNGGALFTITLYKQNPDL